MQPGRALMDPFWKWWILAGVLLILESVAPGFVFLWMGIAASIVGLIAWLTPLNPYMAWVLFAVLSLASILTWLFIRKPQSQHTQMLNKRGQEYIGRTFTLTTPITNGTGKIQLGDTFWTTRGPDCDAGTVVKVQALEDGNLLVVPTREDDPLEK